MAKKKILAVDDSALIHQMYKLFLSRYKNCKLVSAMNGLDALDKLGQEEGIDLILLDINMPVMNGLEFLQRIQKEPAYQPIPVIIISTEGKEEDTIGYIDANTRAIFGRSYAAEPDVLARQLAEDEAIAEARRALDLDPLSLLMRANLGIVYHRARRSDEALAAAWLQVYRDEERWFELYELAEKLLDIDDALASWRHKHVLTVERIIGNKRGTGGSVGAPYLRSTLDKRVFPELWALRTEL